VFYILISLKYPNEERGERRRRIEREEVFSNWLMWIIIVDLEVDDGDELEEDL